ncbi:LysR family transcriptional regulator [Shewanella sp. TC10]|uniref:LysR family transcriptional regulator n=1 Tax=Shewanella sp. TC10 TaxID=1419739 RepID=UPI00129E34A2|nr:LysR family transcriptional regulator [Shewanella sp. TC10]
MIKNLFNNLDLNLLRTFYVLSQERNMRKASKRLFISQPAISQALNKLRHHFDDPLFIKIPTGLKLTPYAETLAAELSPVIEQLADIVNQQTKFAPETMDTHWVIAISPVAINALSAPLFSLFKAAAPLASLKITPWTQQTQSDIAAGKVFIGINYPVIERSALASEKLIELQSFAFVRKKHPITTQYAALEDFAGVEIASMISPDWNDEHSLALDLMTQKGLQAKIGIRSELLDTLVKITEQSDMVLPHTNLFPLHNYPQLRPIELLVNGSAFHIDLKAYFNLENQQLAAKDWFIQLIQQTLKKVITY